MVERTKRQIEIVEALMEGALISAREFELDRETFAERQKTDEMADVIEEFAEWLEERDSDRLEALGVSMEQGIDGRLLFRVPDGDEPFVVRPRADQTIAAGNKIIQLNPDLPILEDEVYAEMLGRILTWATGSASRSQRRFGEGDPN